MGEMPQSLKESLEHSKTEYKNLGKSGLKVSVPILGAMSFGTPEWMPWVLDEEKVFRGAASLKQNFDMVHANTTV